MDKTFLKYKVIYSNQGEFKTMKSIKYIGTALLVSLFFLVQPAFAEDQATKTMAQILINLNHYPSDGEKKQLEKIVSLTSTTKQEKVVATAMINLEHTATAADKKQLSKVMDDGAAPEDVRTLASIVYNLNHKPSSADKAKLEKMQ